MSHKSIQIFPPLTLRHSSTDDIIASHPKKVCLQNSSTMLVSPKGILRLSFGLFRKYEIRGMFHTGLFRNAFTMERSRSTECC